MFPEELSELLRVLAATPARIESLLDNVSDELLRRQGLEGEFSFVENVCHLRDIETEGYSPRISRILNEDLPLLADIDGGRLAVERDYNNQNVNAALTAFSSARSMNLSTIRNLGPDQLSRAGKLDGVGDVKLGDLLVMMRDHDATHLREIEEQVEKEMLERSPRGKITH